MRKSSRPHSFTFVRNTVAIEPPFWTWSVSNPGEMRSLLVGLVLVALQQTTARPPQPDFSGEWVLVDSSGPAALIATTLTVRQPVTTRTKPGTPMPPAYLELDRWQFDVRVARRGVAVQHRRSTRGDAIRGARQAIPTCNCDVPKARLPLMPH